MMLSNRTQIAFAPVLGPAKIKTDAKAICVRLMCCTCIFTAWERTDGDNSLISGQIRLGSGLPSDNWHIIKVGVYEKNDSFYSPLD